MNHRIVLGSLAFVLSLALVSGLQARQKATGAKVTHLELIKELKHAHHLLEKALHDYDGHRAKAAHDVHEAIHDLTAEHHHHNKTTPPANTPAPTNKTANKTNENALTKENQQESDNHLREAAKIVEEVHHQMRELPKGPHHEHAEKHLKAALHQIRTALEIK